MSSDVRAAADFDVAESLNRQLVDVLERNGLFIDDEALERIGVVVDYLLTDPRNEGAEILPFGEANHG